MNFKLLFALCFCAFLFSCSTSEGDAAVAGNIAEKPAAANPATASKKTIVFFGNSLTAGYGLDDLSTGYVALLQRRLDSLGLPYKTVNAGLSGETTAAGKERVSWVIRQPPLDVFVLELGGNDALRGIPPKTSYENLDAIIRTVKEKYPRAKIVLAGMEAPPNLGQAYTSEFRNNYSRLAKKHGAALIPFLLAGVGGVPELNQGDRIHPNEAGQKILTENVWEVLKGVL